MVTKSYTQETLVIDRPSQGLLNLVNKLRERKDSQLEELRKKKEFYFPLRNNK